MEKYIKLLGGLLALQIVLAVWAFSGDSELSHRRSDQALVEFDQQVVDRIEVAGPEGALVTLGKHDQSWVLPDAWNAPVPEDKVNRLLDRLGGLRGGLAVATTRGASERFEVTENLFQRRITLSGGGDPLATLYLGTSPGLRKIHARGAEDEAVYAVAFSAYEAPVKADDWLDGGLLHFEEDKLVGVELPGLTLTRTVGKDQETDAQAGWSAPELAAGEGLDQVKVGDLVRKLARLDVRKVLGMEASPEYRQDDPRLTLMLRIEGSEPEAWVLSSPEAGEDLVVKSSRHPWYFAVASWSAKPLLEAAARAALITGGDEDRADEDGASSAVQADGPGGQEQEHVSESPDQA